ncbi:hypothetical protein [Metabacillus iocasae]|uniref:Nitrate reductase gamma subunit n=1 Tax=Priestia iocasae TaxID=2291674 RepID=A0ABS2QTZ1_9BACI|nr:hypothetical protein [Metabacillus iocasae]MBM7702887.1 nitrate reductase gamma subunit [Metabacillus iocasae]
MEPFIIFPYILFTIVMMYVVYRKRKKQRITGWKSAMPSACMFGVSLSSLAILIFKDGAIVFAMLNVIFLLTGGYFLQHLPKQVN